MSKHDVSCAITKAWEPLKFGDKARAEQIARTPRCDCRVMLKARIADLGENMQLQNRALERAMKQLAEAQAEVGRLRLLVTVCRDELLPEYKESQAVNFCVGLLDTYILHGEVGLKNADGSPMTLESWRGRSWPRAPLTPTKPDGGSDV